MASGTKPVLCGKCDSPANVIREGDINVKMVCSSCGNKADYESAMKSIHQSASDYLAANVRESMKRAARGSKVLKFKSSAVKKRAYSFYTKL